MAQDTHLTQTGQEVQEILNAVANKVDKIPGKGLSSNDYTDDDKEIVDNSVTSEPQSLTDTQKAQARENIGAYAKPEGGIPESDLNINIVQKIASPDDPNAVKFTAQTLTEAQKQQARTNIGAYTKPAGGIPKSDIADGVIPEVDDFIDKTVDDLVNYYLKTEVYTQEEIDQMLATIQQFTYEVVATLPGASASTMHKIYLVPTPGASGSEKDEYITVSHTEGATTTFYWEQIGSTAIDLSDYITVSDLNTALAAKQDIITDLATIRSGAAAGATAYQKPSAGIPKTDLDSSVQDSLDKADTSVQKVDISTNVKTDKASNTKVSSPKSVYQEIYPAVVSTRPSGGMLPNVFYRLGTLTTTTTITFASPSDSTIENEYKFSFSVATTLPAIVWPLAIIKWQGNCLDASSQPSIQQNHTYQVSVLDGLGIIIEF